MQKKNDVKKYNAWIAFFIFNNIFFLKPLNAFLFDNGNACWRGYEPGIRKISTVQFFTYVPNNRRGFPPSLWAPQNNNLLIRFYVHRNKNRYRMRGQTWPFPSFCLSLVSHIFEIGILPSWNILHWWWFIQGNSWMLFFYFILVYPW